MFFESGPASLSEASEAVFSDAESSEEASDSSLSLSRRVSLSMRGTSTARPGHPGCTIDGADDEGNTPLHHARRGPQRPKPTNIRDCWKEFHRNLGLAESVFDYRHQSLSIPPSATAEILREITEIMGHKAMEHGVCHL